WHLPRILLSLGPMLAATLLFVGILWKELKIVSFDPQLASAMGFPARLIHYLLMGMVAAVAVTSFEAVGSILVVAMIVVPPATAHLLTDRLSRMMALAVAVGVISAILGYQLARAYDTSVSGMMAVATGVQFCLAVALAPRYGLVVRSANHLLLSLRIIGDDIVAMLYRTEEHQAQAGPAGGADWGRCVVAGGSGLPAWLALPQLILSGAIRANRAGCRLTDAGRARAQSLVRAHRLWEVYLGEHFDLPLDHLHESAERVEHFLGPKLQDQLARELSAPDRDPHGREIPPPPSRGPAPPN
ncbi:MAG: metal ABC transporter permease, partial [Planctomycetaceae bacterium]|nr:metal ABC transporter permease [Planctomycetaceae bacterium]